MGMIHSCHEHNYVYSPCQMPCQSPIIYKCESPTLFLKEDKDIGSPSVIGTDIRDTGFSVTPFKEDLIIQEIYCLNDPGKVHHTPLPSSIILFLIGAIFIAKLLLWSKK